MADLRALGTARAQFEGLETFESSPLLTCVTLDSDECCAVCPVTGQPDWYRVRVRYTPQGRCLESKTFKLYVQSFRDKGLFCEAFAAQIAADCADVLGVPVEASVVQKPRGGVSIHAQALAAPQSSEG